MNDTTDVRQVRKAAIRRAWDASADGWNRHTGSLHRWLERATDAMLEMALVRHGARVLDVAAGAGDQTLAIAQRVGPGGQVVATDLSPAILALAQENARRAGFAQVTTLVADAEALPADLRDFDAVVCRLGLMLCPDPQAAVDGMFRALRPQGGACAMVFGRPEHNPCVTTVMATACAHASVPRPDPDQSGGLLSLGRPGRLDEMFRRAGFRDVATTRIDAPFEMPSTADYLEFLRSSASPIQQILARLDATAQQAAWDDIATRLDAFTTPQGWRGPNELALTVGRR